MQKLSYEYVYQFFENNGCKLLEDEYVDNQTPMKYKCNHNHISTIRWNDFKKGQRCKKCHDKFHSIYGKKQNNLLQIQQYINGNN